jgi:hypothetical protein
MSNGTNYVAAMAPDVLRRIATARGGAETHLGWVHDVVPHAESGMPGVVLPVTWMTEDGQVNGMNLWIPAPGLLDFFAVLDTMRSEPFKAAMTALEDQLEGKK